MEQSAATGSKVRRLTSQETRFETHPETSTKPRTHMKMKGLPLNLNVYETSETLTNKHFQEFKMSEFERIYLPDSMRPFTNLVPKGTKEFVVDDNRGAVSTAPYLKIDSTAFYLSV